MAETAMVRILKNIYYFLEIIESANNDNISSWNNADGQHAFQWAEYCENIFHKVRNRKIEIMLDEKIRKFDEIPLAVGNADICLDFFKNSKLILTKSLLQNRKLSSSIHRFILSQFKNNAVSKAKLVKVISDIAYYKSALSIKRPILDSLNGDSSLDQAQANILYRHLKKASMCPLKYRRQYYLNHRLDSISNQENGMVLLLRILLVFKDETDPETSPLHKFILKWFIIHINNMDDYEKHRFFIKVPHILITSASSLYFMFFQEYMKYLIWLGKKFNKVESEDHQITWRSTEIVPSTGFMKLCDMVDSLLSCPGRISNHAKVAFEHLAKKNPNGVWKVIYNR